MALRGRDAELEKYEGSSRDPGCWAQGGDGRGGGRLKEKISTTDRPRPMSPTSLVNLSSLVADAKCYPLVRHQRWPEGVRCPACGSATHLGARIGPGGVGG